MPGLETDKQALLTNRIQKHPRCTPLEYGEPGKTEQMNDDADKFTDMLKNYENQYITIDEIYNQDAGKRRKKTRKAKRRPRKTRKSKRQTKRRN